MARRVGHPLISHTVLVLRSQTLTREREYGKLLYIDLYQHLVRGVSNEIAKFIHVIVLRGHIRFQMGVKIKFAL